MTPPKAGKKILGATIWTSNPREPFGRGRPLEPSKLLRRPRLSLSLFPKTGLKYLKSLQVWEARPRHAPLPPLDPCQSEAPSSPLLRLHEVAVQRPPHPAKRRRRKPSRSKNGPPPSWPPQATWDENPRGPCGKERPGMGMGCLVRWKDGGALEYQVLNST